MKEKIYYIQGMHCASCELLIEKKVLKQDGIEVADASMSNQTLSISYHGKTPEIQTLNSLFKADGYSFSHEKKKQKQTWKQKDIIHFVVKFVAVFVVLYLLHRSGITQSLSVQENSSLGVFFVFGLLAGLSSCAALVGGLLLSLSKQWHEKHAYDTVVSVKVMPHMSFHLGRMIAYVVFGALLGSIGASIGFDNTIFFAIVTIIVSIIMLIIGLQMLGYQRAQTLQIRMPKFITRRISRAGDGAGSMPWLIGAGTVLLPCGFTLAAQGVALTSGSAIRGALILLYFVLGTMIPLVFISMISISSSRSARRQKSFAFYIGAVLFIFGLYNINAQFNVLGFVSVSDVFASNKSLVTDVKMTYEAREGEQVIYIIAKKFDYYLQSPSVIDAGKPTKLVIDDQGMQGCGRYMAARGLFSGYHILQPGIQEINIPNPQPGTYKISCTMGMVPPVVITVK